MPLDLLVVVAPFLRWLIRPTAFIHRAGEVCEAEPRAKRRPVRTGNASAVIDACRINVSSLTTKLSATALPCSAVSVPSASYNHAPVLIRRADGRFQVQCACCEESGDTPIGIGIPITSRLVAESIVRNHAGPSSRALP